jgi:hypothetical protein
LIKIGRTRLRTVRASGKRYSKEDHSGVLVFVGCGFGVCDVGDAEGYGWEMIDEWVGLMVRFT